MKEFAELAGRKVAVALSGGVDSAVAALLLKEAGAEVSAVFMKNWEDDDVEAGCHDKADMLAAAAAASALDIPLDVANFAAEYKRRVFEPFLDSLRRGLTPNPDVLCNSEIKFEIFRRHAQEAGAEKIATGHYARISEESGALRLLKGEDSAKDQSYFLHRLSAEQLSDAVFPLGRRHKPDVRAVARAAGLGNWDRRESMGICFIGQRDFSSFLRNYIEESPGPMRDPEGNVVGEHRGLPFYTIGQRRGLDLGGGPWFVAAKDLGDNALIVAPERHPILCAGVVRIENPRWLSGSPPPCRRVFAARLRHRQQPASCTLTFAGQDRADIAFAVPQWAPAPGQYAVIYDGDACLGGGEIASPAGL